jgi:hypothetical protein
MMVRLGYLGLCIMIGLSAACIGSPGGGNGFLPGEGGAGGSGSGTLGSQFVVSEDGLTVTDTVNGLLWQRDGSGARPGCSGRGGVVCSATEAREYCMGLTLAGLGGWYLPSQLQLEFLVDKTVPAPKIYRTAFPNTPAEMFLTSSYSGLTGIAWCIDFEFGEPVEVDGDSAHYRVRCVRRS